jgi:hypothetical protein
MPFQTVTPPDNLHYADPDNILVRLEEALPNHEQEYYADLRERIVLTAVSWGHGISSVIEAFIIGALNRGEGPPATRTEGSVHNV